MHISFYYIIFVSDKKNDSTLLSLNPYLTTVMAKANKTIANTFMQVIMCTQTETELKLIDRVTFPHDINDTDCTKLFYHFGRMTKGDTALIKIFAYDKRGEHKDITSLVKYEYNIENNTAMSTVIYDILDKLKERLL